jgi:hypothetical protein
MSRQSVAVRVPAARIARPCSAEIFATLWRRKRSSSRAVAMSVCGSVAVVIAAVAAPPAEGKAHRRLIGEGKREANRT